MLNRHASDSGTILCPHHFRVDNVKIAAASYTSGHDFATKGSSNSPVNTFVIGFETLAQECGRYVSRYLCRLLATALVTFGGCLFLLEHDNSARQRELIARIQCTLGRVHDVAAGVYEYTSSFKHHMFRRKKRTLWLTSSTAFPVVE